VDASGDVFVTEAGSSTVKEIVAVDGAVSSSSTVKTVGGGFSVPYGVAVDASGDVFVADVGNNAVYEIVAVDGAVSSASTVKTIGGGFIGPMGVALDVSGNVYVNDYSVKEMPAACTSSSCVKTLAGGFPMWGGLAVDPGGNVYLAGGSARSLYELPAGCASSSCVNRLGGLFSDPYGVALDGSGNLYVADAYNYSEGVMKVSLASPPSLNYPTATPKGTTDTTDGPRSVTIANNGNAALTFPVPRRARIPVSPRTSRGITLRPARRPTRVPRRLSRWRRAQAARWLSTLSRCPRAALRAAWS
jgi:hypothetical protein